ncbi:MAG: Rpn family recombination-promoting nuclease/putative transposase [Treponema sp.]|nr:Rpn family recombination-promoting nuclease/putative transposase [Treponema sp.]
MAVYHAKDNSFKLIFNQNELFIQFLKNFLQLDIFKNVRPEDVEDMNRRFLPLFQDSRESDTVKCIILPDKSPLFVIAIVEHESKVNFRAGFKMLQYIALVLNDYEKEQNEKDPGCIFRRDFRYPPVLPVVFYDGPEAWTAERNFLYRTALNDVFEKYIPRFEYELVDLRRYSLEEIMRFGDALSLVMLVDRLGEQENLEEFLEGLEGYVKTLKIPDELVKVVSDAMTVLLSRARMSEERIGEITGYFDGKEYRSMFDALVNRIIREREEGQERGEQKKAREIAQKALAEGVAVELTSRITGLDTETIKELSRKR